MEPNRLTSREYALLAVFAGVLMGFSLVGGRVLTMHESRLPQAAREMFADGDWIVPKCGGRPWLERPPLPHWITVAIASLIGRCDQPWIVRIPPALMGVLCVLLTAWMAARWFGRSVGLLSGAVLATSVEFLKYAWLAEEDIFLAASVLIPISLFVGMETLPASDAKSSTDLDGADVTRLSFIGTRSWLLAAFFLTLGLTNLVKGLLFGAAMVLVTVLGYLAWNFDLARIRRYVWIWGWLIAGATALAWMAAASYRYPDLLQLWTADVVTRTDGLSRRDPLWYYPVSLVWCMAPWSPAALAGMWLSWKRAREGRYSGERFLWCWAVLPVALLSLAHHKHHHYLVPSLAPWAILCALGIKHSWERILTWNATWRNPVWGTLAVSIPSIVLLVLFRERIPGPDWVWQMTIVSLPLVAWTLFWGSARPQPRLAMGTVFTTVGALHLMGHVYCGQYTDTYREDTAFLRSAQQVAGNERTIFVNGHRTILNMFRHLFYLNDQARMLHNLTFLRDDSIVQDEVLVIARYQDAEALREYGEPTILLESRYHDRKSSPDTRWTLFELKYHPGLKRLPNRSTYTAKQVMEREAGPFLAERPGGTALR